MLLIFHGISLSEEKIHIFIRNIHFYLCYLGNWVRIGLRVSISVKSGKSQTTMNYFFNLKSTCHEIIGRYWQLTLISGVFKNFP